MTAAPPFSEGTVLMPWKPGPGADPAGTVFVSVTDFLATSETDVRQIYQEGLELGETWPVLQGAVGVWLWGRPAQLRGGSISVWDSERDMRRFVRWPVHARIMRAWRGRVRVATDSWQADRFDIESVWVRAARTIEGPHRGGRSGDASASPEEDRR
ncbi:hypothetical protein NLM24_25455 [Nocardia zapadnayensis]|uniref:hypothetical protein n=1 Tax=Nocardia rhamnosiphila TaxID=426716 RepID=UPI002245F4CE|nr:hypothetical protein [Nocardia zapadnayensis]MCX0273978.1 hypothetical protein [Nocardia zapadnayensis]